MLLANWSVKVQGTEKGAKVLCATGSRSFLFLTGSITLSQIIYTTNNTKQSKSPTPAKSPTIAKSPTTDNNNHEYEMGIWTSYSRSVPPKVNERTTWWSTWFKWGFRRHKSRHFGKTIQASIRSPSGSASLSRHTDLPRQTSCNDNKAKNNDSAVFLANAKLVHFGTFNLLLELH